VTRRRAIADYRVRSPGQTPPEQPDPRPAGLKHMRNWSYEVVEREVRPNLVYSAFTRVGASKVPDDTVMMNKWALAWGPEGVENRHQRVVKMAQEKKVMPGRKMRLDTNTVECVDHR
jgi:IS5 family transposase